jgi:hypothetical protein
MIGYYEFFSGFTEFCLFPSSVLDVPQRLDVNHLVPIQDDSKSMPQLSRLEFRMNLRLYPP